MCFCCIYISYTKYYMFSSITTEQRRERKTSPASQIIFLCTTKTHFLRVRAMKCSAAVPSSAKHLSNRARSFSYIFISSNLHSTRILAPSSHPTCVWTFYNVLSSFLPFPLLPKFSLRIINHTRAKLSRLTDNDNDFPTFTRHFTSFSWLFRTRTEQQQQTLNSPDKKKLSDSQQHRDQETSSFSPSLRDFWQRNSLLGQLFFWLFFFTLLDFFFE